MVVKRRQAEPGEELRISSLGVSHVLLDRKREVVYLAIAQPVTVQISASKALELNLRDQYLEGCYCLQAYSDGSQAPAFRLTEERKVGGIPQHTFTFKNLCAPSTVVNVLPLNLHAVLKRMAECSLPPPDHQRGKDA